VYANLVVSASVAACITVCTPFVKGIFFVFYNQLFIINIS
jgi:hypothetical protein